MYARAPMRISFGGGNTDVEPYVSDSGGVCFGVAIQKYAYARSGNGKNSNSPLVNAIKEKFNYDENIEIESEAKPFSGLGASGAIAVSVIALIANGRMPKEEMAHLAFDVERKDLLIRGGFQDQIFASFGKLNYIEFGQSRFNLLPMSEEGFAPQLEDKTLIVYLGERQDNMMIHEDEMQRTEQNYDKLDRIKEIGNEMRRLARRNKYNEIGYLLNEAWLEKRSLSPLVSTVAIDEFYEQIIKDGALGFKLGGAGAGGYGMIFCENVSKVWNSCVRMGYTPETIKIDWNGVQVFN